MTGDKVKEVADRYDRVITRAVEIISQKEMDGISPDCFTCVGAFIKVTRGPVDKFWPQWSVGEQASHMIFACAEMKRFVDENHLEKAFRCLGWIQALSQLWVSIPSINAGTTTDRILPQKNQMLMSKLQAGSRGC